MSFYENEEYIEAKKQLKDEYEVGYKKCAVYIHAANYGLEHEENCLMLILDDFLSAQNECKPLSKIIGKDLRKFCDDIIKAELDRITDKTLYIITTIAGILLCIPIIIFDKTFAFMRLPLNAENMNNLSFEGFELLFFVMFLGGFTLKKIASIIFFEHVRISKISSAIIFILFFGSANVIAKYFGDNFPISIPVPFPMILLLFFAPILTFIICAVISKKKKVKYIITMEDVVDELDKVICPKCGKEHDCDYPRCPYCKHKYSL